MLKLPHLKDALGGPDRTPAKSHAAMIAMYRDLPDDQAADYTAMFRYLGAGKVPLAFNCSAGKDRTGLGAALILDALGVPRATILADYALSDRIVDYRAELQNDAKTNKSAAMLAQLPWPVV